MPGEPIDLLAATALFRRFPRDALEPLAASLKRRRFSRGSYICHQGDAGTTFYVIQAGQVKISRVAPSGDEVVLAMLLPGEAFGELALLDETATRSADAQAVGAVECLTLARGPFTTFLDGHPALWREVVTVMTGYLRRSENFAEAAFLDIPGRVARKLLELAEVHGERTGDGTRIQTRISQQELAQMVAATRENVNRALARLRARGDITTRNGYITIVRPAALRRRAQARNAAPPGAAS
jgi:CRP/FNR family transcriptional regulator/CRP/FNR family cyclic AMP-dependent transcriptional regulator